MQSLNVELEIPTDIVRSWPLFNFILLKNIFFKVTECFSVCDIRWICREKMGLTSVSLLKRKKQAVIFKTPQFSKNLKLWKIA